MKDINDMMRAILPKQDSVVKEDIPIYTCTICGSPFQCKHSDPSAGSKEHRDQHMFKFCCTGCWDMGDIPF